MDARRNSVAPALILVIAIAFAACDDSPAGPIAQTPVEAQVRDSPGQSTVTGTFTGNFFASLWDGDRWVDLGSPNGITVAMQSGAPTTVHGEQGVPADSYSRVRLVLQGVTARIASGSSIGGATLTSDRTIALGGSDQRAELVVSVSAFDVGDDATLRRRIVFDLRSPQWLTSSVVQSASVDDAALQSAISASTAAEPR